MVWDNAKMRFEKVELSGNLVDEARVAVVVLGTIDA
jgi:hypothetical protein